MAKTLEADAPIQLPAWVGEQFSAFERSLNGHAAEPLHLARKNAFERFRALGFPTPRDEAWKYTNVSEVVSSPHALAAIASERTVPQGAALDFGGRSLVLVNGKLDASPSAREWPPGLQVAALDEALAGRASKALVDAAKERFGRCLNSENDGLVQLNSAFLSGGVILLVDDGVQISEPVSITSVTVSAAPASSFPRILAVVGANAKFTLIERHIGAGSDGYLSAGVTEIAAGDGAQIDHYKIIEELPAAANLGTVACTAGRSAHLRTHAFTFGGAVVRNQLTLGLHGEGAYALLNGLTVISGRQHVDNYTVLDHAQPHCESHELYKGIYADRSEGVFSGTIIVQPGAQKTNAYQSNQSVLLSDEASVNSRPQLKIWADDVKCTHGATVGQLDDDALFYLRSRGIGIADARNMLIHAFAGEVIGGVHQALRAHLEQALLAKLAH